MNSTVYADILRASSTMFYRRAAVISSSSFVLFTARQQFSPVFCIAESVVAYFHSYAVSRRLCICVWNDSSLHLRAVTL